MTEINHAGYYMNIFPRPELTVKGVDNILVTAVSSDMRTTPVLMISMYDIDNVLIHHEYKIKSILIGENVSCRISAFVTVTTHKYVFSTEVKCTYREGNLIITALEE